MQLGGLLNGVVAQRDLDEYLGSLYVAALCVVLILAGTPLAPEMQRQKVELPLYVCHVPLYFYETPLSGMRLTG
jgi:hypothetical protein